MIPQGAVREYVIYGDGLGEGEGDAEVTAAADQYGMVMIYTGLRCFLH